MRALLRRGGEREFDVDLTVHRLNSIPVTHRMMFIHWRLARRDAASAAHYGFTESKPVEPGNVVTWESPIAFTARIGADPGDADALTLQKTVLQLQVRSERRSRIGVPSYNPEGVVEIDLADVAALGSLDKNFLVQESLLNATLHVSVRMRQISGDKVFRTRAAALAGTATPLQPSASTDTLSVGAGVSAAATTSAPAGASDASLVSLAGASARTLKTIRSVDSRQDRRVAPPSMNTLPPLARTGSFARPPSSVAYSLTSGRSGDGLMTDVLMAMPSTAAVGTVRRVESEEAAADAIPDPESVQARVYEQLFYERLRDEWPEGVKSSRQDSWKMVEEIYSRVCAQDGIKQVGRSREPSTVGSDTSNWQTLDDQKMTVEGLLESLYR